VRLRIWGVIGAVAGAVALASVVPMRTAAQGTGGSGFQAETAQRNATFKGTPAPGGGMARSGCVEDIGPEFEKCAQEKMKTFQPPRTEDGHPDFRGYWGRVLQSMTLETRGPDHPERRRNDNRRTHAIIDPPNGTFPYQPWAAAQAEENFKLYIDPLANLYPPGAHRFPYISSGGYLFLQPRGKNQLVLLMEEIHLSHTVPLDGRPHISPRIKLYEGDWVGQWEGNTLVIDITNNNGETWFDQAGDFLSDAAHIVQRWTLIDPDVIHVQVTVNDPKVFTQPLKYAMALVRLQRVCPECTEIYEEASFEGDRDLPAMYKSHGRYPGFNGLPAAKGR
jgi:hypothetical protein